MIARSSLGLLTGRTPPFASISLLCGRMRVGLSLGGTFVTLIVPVLKLSALPRRDDDHEHETIPHLLIITPGELRREHPTSRERILTSKGEDNAFDLGQGFAVLEIAPNFAVAIGEASKTFALHNREVLDRGGVRFFIFAYGKVAHGLDRGCFFRRLLLLNINLHKF